MDNELELQEIAGLLKASYVVPLTRGHYRIALYVYGKESVGDIIGAAYHEIPSEMICGEPSLAEMERFSLDLDPEFAIFINEDVCPAGEMMSAMVECLYKAASKIADNMQSEEFGARVMTAAFKEFAPALEGEISDSDSTTEGLATIDYPFPIVNDNYKITLTLYNDSEKCMDSLYEKIGPKYKKSLLSGRMDPKCDHGFVAKPADDELAMFINCTDQSVRLQREIFVHELFHAATRIAELFDSSVIGGNLYRTLYDYFSEILFNCEQNNYPRIICTEDKTPSTATIADTSSSARTSNGTPQSCRLQPDVRNAAVGTPTHQYSTRIST